MTGETLVHIESVRVPHTRNSRTDNNLARSIKLEGLHRPITLWKDGTVVSGQRRLRAYLLLQKSSIPAVFVGTIEDAAKNMLADSQDTYHAVKPTWSEVCRLWAVLRHLDAPAATLRLDANRRAGAELRRQTLSGKRKPGRGGKKGEDYFLEVLAEPFGISSATAKRIDIVWRTANGHVDVSDERRELARDAMRSIDETGNVWANYQRLTGARAAPVVRVPKPVAADSAPVAQQLNAWERSLPTLEGLVAGLVELGPPNPALGWHQVGPVHARLSAVRRELEKMIKQMKEISK